MEHLNKSALWLEAEKMARRNEKAFRGEREPVEHDELPRCDCGHLFEICNAPNCPAGDDPNH